ncbi:MAG: hypothetical protein HY453_00345 [Parcubacteria group bacterium]|nr:hypothetical protein [Parcubacteria group bacterium]
MRQNQRGVILIASLLITSLILTGGVIVSEIIVRQTQITKKIENAFLAYYGADAAIETGLYGLRKEGKGAAELNGSGEYGNQVRWERDVIDQASDIGIDAIAEDEFEIVEVYVPGSVTGVPAGIESFRISWNIGVQLEVTVRTWDGVSFAAESVTTYFCGGVTPCNDIVESALSADSAYQIRIRAKNDDALDLHVRFYAADGAPSGNELSVPVPVTMTSKGVYKNSQKALRVTVPATTPWSGLP